MLFNKKAGSGIDTLIIFIAMIIVAAVAAGVVIQTSIGLQSKALLTGTKSTSEVSTSLQIFYAYGGEANSTNHDLETIYFKMRLAPGSDPVKLDDTAVIFTGQTARQSYGYIGTPNNCTSAPASGIYDVKYISGNPFYGEGYMSRNDIVLGCISSPVVINEGAEFSISIHPRAGQVANVDLVAPNVLVQKEVQLFP